MQRLIEGAGRRPPIPREDLDLITAAVRATWQAQVRRARRRRRSVVFALAALLALALGVGWWWWQARQPPSTVAWVEATSGAVVVEIAGRAQPALPGQPIPAGAVLRTAAGAAGEGAGRGALQTTSGVTLRLDAGTRMGLASATRWELTSGAIYADTSDGHGELEVRTPVGTVRDIGTRFSLRLEGESEPLLRVQVREGAVAVEGAGRSDLAREGEELELDAAGNLERRRVLPYGSAWEWVLAAGPPFEIEGRSLRELLDWVARETGWRVRFEDAQLAAAADGVVLHGSLGDLRPDQAPFAVLPGAGLEGKVEGGVLVIRDASRRQSP